MHHALKAVRGMPRDEGMHVAPLPPFDCRGKRGDEGGRRGTRRRRRKYPGGREEKEGQPGKE